ncbi:MAG: CoA transferase [Pseudomonadota bacterium]
MPMKARPLAGLTVLDFSQFLSGPFCTLKLADFGARVIKVERPGSGDLCRHLYISEVDIAGDNSLFHAINRNKESVTANLKDPEDRAKILDLIADADVMVQNFRPGVIERQGLGYEDVRTINPRVIYGSISGYGEDGPWKDFPGQDLLAQARSGLLWLSGSAGDPPIPMGLAVADMLAGHALCEGILAALVGRGIHGRGARVDTSLLEAMIDFQFEVLTTYLNDGNRAPNRSAINGAHAYLGAPYGVYETRDGFIAIAMTPSLQTLADLMEIEGLEPYFGDPKTLMRKRDTIKGIMASAIKQRTTEAWLSILQPADIWCSEVLDWPSLLASAAYTAMDFEQTIRRTDDVRLKALRPPVRIDGQTLKSERAAPMLGEHNDAVFPESLLDLMPAGSIKQNGADEAHAAHTKTPTG